MVCTIRRFSSIVTCTKFWKTYKQHIGYITSPVRWNKSAHFILSPSMLFLLSRHDFAQYVQPCTYNEARVECYHGNYRGSSRQTHTCVRSLDSCSSCAEPSVITGCTLLYAKMESSTRRPSNHLQMRPNRALDVLKLHTCIALPRKIFLPSI